MRFRPLRCIVAALVLAAASARAETEYYLVDTIAAHGLEPGLRAQARALRAIYDDLARVSGVEAELVYSNDPDINAFATEVGEQKIVLVQEGLLARMHGDRDMVAAVLAHELAHHHADHIREGHSKREGILVFGAILGAVVGAKVGRDSGALAGAASNAAVGVGATLIALKFSRSQELESDRLAIDWMIEAGYNPDGMLRLQQTLGALDGKRRAAIVSTHPTSAKRYRAAEKHIATLAPPVALRAQPVAPLAERAEVEAAAAELEHEVAAALAEIEGASAAALAPPANEPTRTAAAREGVHIGDDTHVGSNVRVGGRELERDPPAEPPRDD